MDESLSGSTVVTEPNILDYMISVIKIMFVVTIPLGLFLWWKTRDERRREREKRAQEQFNLILTRETQRQKSQSS